MKNFAAAIVIVFLQFSHGIGNIFCQSFSFIKAESTHIEVPQSFNIDEHAEILHFFVPKSQKRQMTIGNDIDGFSFKEINLLDHENVYPKWYSPPRKTVYTKDGIVQTFESVTSNGGIDAIETQLKEEQNIIINEDGSFAIVTEADLNHTNWHEGFSLMEGNIDSYLFEELPFPSQSEIDELGIVADITDDYISIIVEDIRLTHFKNIDAIRLEVLNGELDFTEIKYFKPHNGMGYVVSRSIERRQINTDGGVCLTEVKESKFTDYDFQHILDHLSSRAYISSEDTSLSNDSEIHTKYLLSSADGKVLNSFKTKPKIQDLQSIFSPGLYFLTVANNGLNKTEKIVIP